MQFGDEQASQGFAWFGDGDYSGEQTASGIGCGIRPGTAAPSMVKVSKLGDGALFFSDLVRGAERVCASG